MLSWIFTGMNVHWMAPYKVYNILQLQKCLSYNFIGLLLFVCRHDFLTRSLAHDKGWDSNGVL
jgi:hypothetical protein